MPQATSLPPSLHFREKNCREKNCRENLPTLSAQELHQMCFEAHRLGNRARRRYLFALLALHRTGLYSKLGCSSIAQYAEEGTATSTPKPTRT